jgi:hypothetical protein
MTCEKKSNCVGGNSRKFEANNIREIRLIFQLLIFNFSFLTQKDNFLAQLH